MILLVENKVKCINNFFTSVANQVLKERMHEAFVGYEKAYKVNRKAFWEVVGVIMYGMNKINYFLKW